MAETTWPETSCPWPEGYSRAVPANWCKILCFVSLETSIIVGEQHLCSAHLHFFSENPRLIQRLPPFCLKCPRSWANRNQQLSKALGQEMELSQIQLAVSRSCVCLSLQRKVIKDHCKPCYPLLHMPVFSNVNTETHKHNTRKNTSLCGINLCLQKRE